MLRKFKLQFFLYLGLSLAFISLIGNAIALEPFHAVFFAFASWAFVILLDLLLNRLTNASLLMASFTDFIILALASLLLVSTFELLNLRILNWHYIFVPSNTALHRAAYFFTIASLAPAIIETVHLLETGGILAKIKTPRFILHQKLLNGFILTGALCLLSALIMPKYCSILVWPGLFFILDPILCKAGRDSLLQRLANGNPERLISLKAAALLCGLLWAFIIMQSGTKPVFTLPGSGSLPYIFEQPLLLYILLPSFAFSAYAVYNMLAWLKQSSESFTGNAQNQPETKTPLPAWVFPAACLAIFLLYWLTIRLIETHTIRLYLAI